jgi:hypothetical protein
MKKLILSLLAFAIVFSISAQEKIKQKEIGVGFQSLDNFALIYKFGHQKSMWRLMSAYGGINSSKSEVSDLEDKDIYTSFGVSFGKQFHSYINNDFRFIYGIDINFVYSSSKSIQQELEYDYERKMKAYAPGLDVVLGFNYNISENFVIGLELLPGINYSISEIEYKNANNGTKDYTQKANQFYANARTSSALLTLAYRFGKKSD